MSDFPENRGTLTKLSLIIPSAFAIVGQSAELGLLGSLLERPDHAAGDEPAEVQEVRGDGLQFPQGESAFLFSRAP